MDSEFMSIVIITMLFLYLYLYVLIFESIEFYMSLSFFGYLKYITCRCTLFLLPFPLRLCCCVLILEKAKKIMWVLRSFDFFSLSLSPFAYWFIFVCPFLFKELEIPVCHSQIGVVHFWHFKTSTTFDIIKMQKKNVCECYFVCVALWIGSVPLLFALAFFYFVNWFLAPDTMSNSPYSVHRICLTLKMMCTKAKWPAPK